MIDIVLADDHRMVRMGFRMLIDQQPDMTVVGEASNPDEAFDLLVEHQPDVLVSDISMGGQKSGLLLAERIMEAGLPCAVVVLTMHEEQEYLRQAMERGAKGYVLKSSSDEALFGAIRAAVRDETFICPELLGGFVQNAISGAATTTEALTPRETEIVSLAVRGYSNQDVAKKLGISVKTVESQKSKIMSKLGLESKPELFEYAVSHGLVSL